MIGHKTSAPFQKEILDIYLAVAGLVGTTAILNIIRDITERKRNEDRIKLLLREVHHRIKNNMATVKGILSLQAEKRDQMRVGV